MEYNIGDIISVAILASIAIAVVVSIVRDVRANMSLAEALIGFGAWVIILITFWFIIFVNEV